jgi:hypothetical protein
MDMPIRERFAWMWLATMIVAYGAYFAAVALLPGSGETPALRDFGLLAAAGAAQMAALGLFWLIVRLRAGRDFLPPRDERDRAIEHRSSAMAYYVLIAGMILVGCVMPFGAGGWDIVHAAILAIVVAELVHHGMVVVGYRRGWRG